MLHDLLYDQNHKKVKEYVHIQNYKTVKEYVYVSKLQNCC